MRRLLQLMLARVELDLEVEIVAQSREAWALCQEQDFTLVILSLEYPVLDLFHKSIMQRQGSSRCLLLTDCFGSGQFLDYPCLAKPFALTELIPTVRNLLLKAQESEE